MWRVVGRAWFQGTKANRVLFNWGEDNREEAEEREVKMRDERTR